MGAPGPVLLSGATGLIGRRLLVALDRDGDDVRALTRRPERAAPEVVDRAKLVGWDGRHFEPEHVAGASAVVHLAGEPVFAGRLTGARRQRILESRVDSTASLVEALGRVEPGERPALLACASAVGFYGSRGDEALEESAASGQGFLAEVCRQWETAAQTAAALGVRVVSLRFGIVLAREGGALPRMATPFRLGLGGRLGNGRQWFPWIHVDDVVRLVSAILRDDTYAGPVNVVAPEPVRNAELTRSLGRLLRRPALLPVPAFVLRAALGELSDELLGSRRVLPAAALARGFAFVHPGLDSALAAELGDG
jgi:uncharacterized protein (TIGR01777 family)